MKLKPIEAGCNAIITNQDSAENRGKHVKVELLIPLSGEFVHDKKTWVNNAAKQGVRMWKVVGANVNGLFNGVPKLSGFAAINEKNLMRIDGEDFSDEDNPYAVKDKDRHHA